MIPMTGILVYLLIVIVGSIVIAARGRKLDRDRSYDSFGLVVLLLLVTPFGFGLFEISIEGCSTGSIPAAFLLVALFLLAERDRLSDFYISVARWLPSLGAGVAISLLFVFPFFLLLISLQGGKISLMSGGQVMTEVVIAARIALLEELLFRGFLLGYLRRYSLSPLLANIVQASWFAVGHPRYFVTQNWALVGFMVAFGMIAGWISLRYRNLAGSILAHFTANLVPSLLGFSAIMVN